MGNHVAGHNVAMQAKTGLASRRSGQSALEILDAAVARAKAMPGFSPDAEFESTDPDTPDEIHPDYSNETDPHPGAALGMLMLEAFAPNGLADLDRYRPMLDGTPDGEDSEPEEAACDAWFSEVHEPFKTRYGFC